MVSGSSEMDDWLRARRPRCEDIAVDGSARAKIATEGYEYSQPGNRAEQR